MRRSLAVASVAFAVSYGLVRSTRTRRLDRAVGGALARPLGHVADTAIAAATDLGSAYAVAGITAALAATGRRRAAIDAAGAGAVGWTAAQAAKRLAARPRPYQADAVARLVAEPAGSSWPSGHAAVAAAVGTALGGGLPPRGRAAAAAAVGFVALSRIYVGVHYASDVVAGLALGAWSAAAWRGIRRILLPGR